MEEVDILECESLAVCDAYDGEINVFGQQIQKESGEPTHMAPNIAPNISRFQDIMSHL